MKIFFDENIKAAWKRKEHRALCAELAIEAIKPNTNGIADRQVLLESIAHDAVLVTRDWDFLALSLITQSYPGVVFMAPNTGRSIAFSLKLLLKALPRTKPDFFRNQILVFYHRKNSSEGAGLSTLDLSQYRDKAGTIANGATLATITDNDWEAIIGEIKDTYLKQIRLEVAELIDNTWYSKVTKSAAKPEVPPVQDILRARGQLRAPAIRGPRVK